MFQKTNSADDQVKDPIQAREVSMQPAVADEAEDFWDPQKSHFLNNEIHLCDSDIGTLNAAKGNCNNANANFISCMNIDARPQDHKYTSRNIKVYNG